MNIKIVGASPDPVSDNKAFADKIKSPFPLLSDTNQALPEAVGSKDKRWAALLDGGQLKKLWEEVDPETGAQDILDDLGKYFAELAEKKAAVEAARTEVVTAAEAAKEEKKSWENTWASKDVSKMDDPWGKRSTGVVHSTAGGV